MPKIEHWDNLPEGVRQHLIDRMRDRAISVADLNQLRVWIESKPDVPEGDWYKDFASFKICGQGSSPPTARPRLFSNAPEKCPMILSKFAYEAEIKTSAAPIDCAFIGSRVARGGALGRPVCW